MTSFEICREAEPVTMMELRDVAPAHFVLHISSFSLFAKNSMEKYESREFEAGGYKWKLILYPNGDKSRDGQDHISVYLAASGTSSFPPGGQIHATVRFTLYDQICDSYFIKQGRVTRFHALKNEWGIPRYMPLRTFNNPSNGYLVDDSCVFGVEVFVIKSSGVGERLMLKENPSYTHEWKIPRLSGLGEGYLSSDVFATGDHKWQVALCPRGDRANRDQNLSLYLYLNNADKLSAGQRVSVSCIIRLKGRYGIVRLQPEARVLWFDKTIRLSGWPSAMPLKTVQERLTEDSYVLEAEVKVLGTTSELP